MGAYKNMGIEMSMSPNLRKIINHWTTNGKNRSIKKGLTKASKVPLKEFRIQTMELRKMSDQSTGATHRSLSSKGVFPSQGNKNYGYCYTGVEMHYEEMVERKPSFSGAGKVRQHIRKAKFAGIGTRINKKTGKKRVRAVKGYQKYLRHSNKSSTPKGKQLSIPGQYWHLINEGFNHKSGVYVPGRHFDRKNQAASGQKMVSILNNAIKATLK